MRCPSCGFENPSEIRFCGECGAALNKICPNCGFKNPAGFKFCGECATSLIDKAPASKSALIDKQQYNQEDKGAQVTPIVTERKASEAERR
ncbi:MAG: zinc ribbon domain-containing protein [Candidatus Dadabacteria bacterium]|nr:zinc ribbon domain-containing protein [Candidatus Dadabacteria bacterium]